MDVTQAVNGKVRLIRGGGAIGNPDDGGFGVGAVNIDFIAVTDAVAVAVRVVRIGTSRLFARIIKPVVVRVACLFSRGQRIEAVIHFEPIRKPVTVRVGIIGIRAKVIFLLID